MIWSALPYTMHAHRNYPFHTSYQNIRKYMFANPVESFVQILTTMWNLLIQCEEDDWTFGFFFIHCINVDKIRIYMYRFFISLDAHCEAEHQSSAATKCIFSDSPCLVLRIIVHQSGKQRVMCVSMIHFPSHSKSL